MAVVPSVIKYRRLGFRLVFSSEGIAMHAILRRPVQVSWSEVDFVSAIPAAHQVDGAWRFRDFGLSRGWDILRDRGRFVLDVVVHDRHALKRRFRWYAAGLVPLSMADDRPHPRQGTFPLELRVGCLDAKPTDLLELVARHARFELLCHSD